MGESSCGKELEADGLITRHEYPQVPPKVEYALSERGRTLMPVLHDLCEWGHEHMDDNVAVATGAANQSPREHSPVDREKAGS